MCSLQAKWQRDRGERFQTVRRSCVTRAWLAIDSEDDSRGAAAIILPISVASASFLNPCESESIHPTGEPSAGWLTVAEKFHPSCILRVEAEAEWRHIAGLLFFSKANRPKMLQSVSEIVLCFIHLMQFANKSQYEKLISGGSTFLLMI